MTDAPKAPVETPPAETSTSSALTTFGVVFLLLAAVVGGAWVMNHANTQQANVTTEAPASTGSSTGEAGQDTK